MLSTILITVPEIPRAYATDTNNAGMAYMSNTGASTTSSPKYRVYHSSNGSTGAEQELATAGSALRQMQLQWSPISTKCLLITSSVDGNLDAYVSNNCYNNAVSWTTTNNFGSIRTSTGNYHYRAFDVAFERTTGNAIVAWGAIDTDGTHDIAYVSVPVGTLSLTGLTVNYFDTTTASGDMNYTWVTLMGRTGSTCVSCNSILLFGLENSLDDAYYGAWDGSTFENETRIFVSMSTTAGEGGAAALRNSTGLEALAAMSDSSGGNAGVVRMKVYNFNTGAVTTPAPADYGTGTTNHMSVRCDTVANNGCIVVSVDTTTDLNTIHVANTNTVTLQTQEDAAVDNANERIGDIAWNGSNSTAICMWGTATGSLTYQRVTVPDTWGASATITLGGLKSFVQCKMNPTAGDYLAALCLVILAAGTTTPDIDLISWLGGSDAPKDNLTLTADSGLGATAAANPHVEVISLEFQLSTTSPIITVIVYAALTLTSTITGFARQTIWRYATATITDTITGVRVLLKSVYASLTLTFTTTSENLHFTIQRYSTATLTNTATTTRNIQQWLYSTAQLTMTTTGFDRTIIQRYGAAQITMTTTTSVSQQLWRYATVTITDTLSGVRQTLNSLYSAATLTFTGTTQNQKTIQRYSTAQLTMTPISTVTQQIWRYADIVITNTLIAERAQNLVRYGSISINEILSGLYSLANNIFTRYGSVTVSEVNSGILGTRTLIRYGSASTNINTAGIIISPNAPPGVSGSLSQVQNITITVSVTPESVALGQNVTIFVKTVYYGRVEIYVDQILVNESLPNSAGELTYIHNTFGEAPGNHYVYAVVKIYPDQTYNISNPATYSIQPPELTTQFNNTTILVILISAFVVGVLLDDQNKRKRGRGKGR